MQEKAQPAGLTQVGADVAAINIDVAENPGKHQQGNI